MSVFTLQLQGSQYPSKSDGFYLTTFLLDTDFHIADRLFYFQLEKGKICKNKLILTSVKAYI